MMSSRNATHITCDLPFIIILKVVVILDEWIIAARVPQDCSAIQHLDSLATPHPCDISQSA
jgi:hypothetical protein